jgi:sugar phosphate isomerase/epimerase
MKLAFTTLACPNWTLEQAVEAARRYGYEGIELRLLDGEVIQPTIDTEQRERVRRVFADAAMPIVCVDTSVRIAQPNPEQREAQVRDGLAMLELAAAWGAPCIRVFGGPPQGTSDADAAAGAIETLRPLAERGRELGVAVLLETHDAFASGASVAEVLAGVPGPGAGALWDTLHPNRVGEATAETLGLIGARLAHVHIKDGSRPADGGPNWPLTLLGEGDVPMQEILTALRGAGYNGWLAVEWEKKWHPHIAEPEVALPQHIEVLRRFLKETP